MMGDVAFVVQYIHMRLESNTGVSIHLFINGELEWPIQICPKKVDRVKMSCCNNIEE